MATHSGPPDPPDAAAEPPEDRADRLRERVYVAFTTLAVVIAMRSGHVGSAEEASLTLLIVVLGTLLAGLVSHVVSHTLVYEALPRGGELAHMLRITGGALGSLMLPFVFMGLAVAGVWELEQALRFTTIALVASLVVIGYLAARRVRLRPWQRVMVLLAEFAVGAGVLALELLAHA